VIYRYPSCLKSLFELAYQLSFYEFGWKLLEFYIYRINVFVGYFLALFIMIFFAIVQEHEFLDVRI